MDATFLAAYSNTDYYADTAIGRIKLRSGEYSQELDDLQKSRGVTSSAFITAWNPRSIPTDESENVVAQKALYEDICAMGLDCISGIGKIPRAWAGERSFLGLGLSEVDSLNLGKKYGQNAVLFAGPQAIPYLVFPFLDEGLS